MVLRMGAVVGRAGVVQRKPVFRPCKTIDAQCVVTRCNFFTAGMSNFAFVQFVVFAIRTGVLEHV